MSGRKCFRDKLQVPLSVKVKELCQCLISIGDYTVLYEQDLLMLL